MKYLFPVWCRLYRVTNHLGSSTHMENAFYIQGHSSTSHKDMDFQREYDLKMTIKFSILGKKIFLK